MYSREEIESLFGTDSVERIDARHKGGESGQKGTRFEDYFATHLLASRLGEAYGQKGFRDHNEITFHSQAYAFVDDLVVELKGKGLVEHYQLKNASSVSWGSGEDSIGVDFASQGELCSKKGLKGRLFLVVSSKSQRRKLDEKRKAKNINCEKVLYFPYAIPNNLLLTYKPFRHALVKISPFHKKDAENDKLSALATFLLGTWVAAPNKLALEELAKKLEESGCPARPMGRTRKLPSDVAKILKVIPGFKFWIRKGYLFWEWRQTDNGMYPFHTGTKAFDNLSKRIRQSRPNTFEALEVQLA